MSYATSTSYQPVYYTTTVQPVVEYVPVYTQPTSSNIAISSLLNLQAPPPPPPGGSTIGTSTTVQNTTLDDTTVTNSTLQNGDDTDCTIANTTLDGGCDDTLISGSTTDNLNDTTYCATCTLILLI